MVGLCEGEELQHSSMVARTSRMFCGVCGRVVCGREYVGGHCIRAKRNVVEC